MSPCPFPTTITITPRTPPLGLFYAEKLGKQNFFFWQTVLSNRNNFQTDLFDRRWDSNQVRVNLGVMAMKGYSHSPSSRTGGVLHTFHCTRTEMSLLDSV